MIHDYYLANLPRTPNLEILQRKIGEDKKNITLAMAQNIRSYIPPFYPAGEIMPTLPNGSFLLKISFTLKKPYTSKDEGEFYVMDDRIFENPIVRDKLFYCPMVRPSTWKGNLRFASRKVDMDEEKKKTLSTRLFGQEKGDDDCLRGRLHFYPTFFAESPGKEVITPLKRDSRTPRRGPIPLEAMKAGQRGDFYLLYVPYPRGEEFQPEELKEDFALLVEALKLMFFTYGFGAKKTAGWGVVKEEIKIVLWRKSGERKAFNTFDELKNELLEHSG